MKKLIFILLAAALIISATAVFAAAPPADGQYSAEVMLSGGSGRAKIDSPAVITVENGKATARIVWNSSSYEFMTVNGETYRPSLENGHAVFNIPITFDEQMAVSAQTTAMSRPHLIDYTIFVDSAKIKPVHSNGISSLTAAAVIFIAALAAALIFKRVFTHTKGENR